MSRLRVALVTNIPAPYTTPIYEKLASHPTIDLMIYYAARSQRNRQWAVTLDGKFAHKFLSGFAISHQGRDLFSYEINPTVVSELSSGHYDVIIAGGYASFACQAAFFLSRLKGIPFVQRSGSTAYEPGPLRSLSRPLVQTIVHGSDALLPYGSRARDYLLALGADPRRVFIAHNCGGVDYFLERSAAPQSYSTAPDGATFPALPFVLFVGQLIERKGVRYLLEAYRRLAQETPGVGLVLAGNGPLKADLVDFCQRHQLSGASFLGFQPRASLVHLYGAASLLVLPSLVEPYGQVVAEAMACGLPVIATDRCGIGPDLIEEGVNGHVVPAADSEALCRAMRWVLAEPGRAQRMGQECRRIVQSKLAVEHSVKGFVEAIESAVDQRKRRWAVPCYHTERA